MSIGIGGFANKIIENDTSVTYKYGSYNLNISGYDNIARVSDGKISIDKKCFIKPKIHRKIKKINGKKELIENKTILSIDYSNMIENNLIIVENCTNCWKTYGYKQTDICALNLINKILHNYQINEHYPETISFDKWAQQKPAEIAGF